MSEKAMTQETKAKQRGVGNIVRWVFIVGAGGLMALVVIMAVIRKFSGG